MSRQNIDFEQGSALTGDSGERGNDALIGVVSIKPYSDGEPATAAVLDRTHENVRQRTEVLRNQAEGQKYLADSDMRWIITRGLADGSGAGGVPTITAWDPVSGSFTTSDAIVVQPLNTPDTDLKETVTYSFPTAAPTDYIYISSLLYDFELANTLRIIWESADPGDIIGGVPGRCDFALSGAGNHILTITYADDGTCTVTNLDTLLTSPASLITLNSAGFDCSTTITVPLTPVLIADFTPIGSNPADYTMEGTFDRELHYIPAASFVDFFAVPNSLTDGDTLAIAFADLHVDLTFTGRRDRVPGKANTTVSASDLFITSDNPENIPGCIPLCKRIGDDLLWLDGTFCYYSTSTHSPYPLRFGEHGYTVDRIVNGAISGIPVTMSSMWFGAMAAPAWTTINAGFNGVVSDLGAGTAPGGASKIGVAPYTTSPLSLGYYNVPGPGGASLNTVVDQLLEFVSHKASLNSGGPLYADPHETVTGRWAFHAPIRIGTTGVASDIPVLRAWPSDTDYHLVYRNGGRTETNTDVAWSTYSVYERITAGFTPEYLEVWGGYSDGTGNITTPSAGTGSVWVQKGPNHNTYVRINATAAATYSLTDPTDWDYSELIGVASVLGEDWTTRYIYGNATYSAGVLNRGVWWWKAAQVIEEDVDILGTGAADEGPRVYLQSSPLNYVLDGFQVYQENPADPLTWTRNCFSISSGRAFVNGKPVTITGPTLWSFNVGIDPPATYLMKATAAAGLPTDDDTADVYSALPGGIPAFYYLWLRADGNFFLGKLPPMSSGIPGTTLYRPDASEVHVPSGGVTWGEQHYVLCDVVVLWRYSAAPIFGGWWFDGVPDVGGGRRTFFTRKLLGNAGNTINPLIDYSSLISWPVSGVVSSYYNAGGGSEFRSPGIPLGVTRNAIIGYMYTSSLATGDEFKFKIQSYEASLHPWSFTDPVADMYPAQYESFQINGAAVDFAKSGFVDVNLSTDGSIYRTISSDGTGGSAKIYISGFYWNRNDMVRRGMIP